MEAIALKLAGIRYAREQGFEAIVTTNDATNAGMWRLNERLGFVRRQVVTRFVRRL